jgi:AAA family ATP:ADP antiporter
MAADSTPLQPKTPLDRLLGLAAEVRAGEGTTALLLAINGFLLLAAYYTIRPVRAALLLPVSIPLPGGGTLPGQEITAYSGGLLAALFLVIVPLYGRIASRFDRIRLINVVTWFFVINLIAFFLFGRLTGAGETSNAGAASTTLGVAFFLWIGVFNLMVMAQFWSFANDVYTPEQGKRLFAIVGFGGSVGAAVGSVITRSLTGRFGVLAMMLIAAALLVLGMLISNIVHRRDRRATEVGRSAEPSPQEPLARTGGFQLVLSQPYLLFIGLLTLTVQIVNTNGNFILNNAVADMASAAVRSGAAGGQTESQIIAGFFAGTDFLQNVLALFIQFFLVSRIFKYFGIGGALFVLPILAFTSYGLVALLPLLSLIRVTKIAENATDYSLQNTVRRALFLPTSREAKYKALQAVETFFWRAGDMLSAIMVAVVVNLLAISARGFAVVNLGLVVLWLIIAVRLYRENRRLMAQSEAVAA